MLIAKWFECALVNKVTATSLHFLGVCEDNLDEVLNDW